jgi:antitoxin component YwqK of YwqJK toxin-antitoxin module
METTKNKFGLLHSIDDQPSLIDDEGNTFWHKDGRFHRDNDLPAIIMNNGDQYWHINGVPSRLDISFPYIEMYNGEKHYILENGGERIISKIEEEWLDKDGEFHREDGPAYIRYNENGNIKYKSYFSNNKLHREDGPASIQYYENGNIQCEYYYLNGKIHKEDGPAYTVYYENGNIKYEAYYLNGKINKEDGPAYTAYNENGNIESEKYYLNDFIYSQKKYLEKIKELKSCNNVF